MSRCFLSFASDEKLRFRATSGGCGSALLRWLFDRSLIGTAVSFRYCPGQRCYQPVLIHRYEDYEVTGSVYHEVDLVAFLKTHSDEILGGFACFCLPCQARAIRQTVSEAGHAVFLMGLACSSQLSLDATGFLLRRLHVQEEDVAEIRYRGDGWPGGVRIVLKDGDIRMVPNLGSVWTQVFHSRLFSRRQCYTCALTLNPFSDITLADPWLPEVIGTEKTGKTLLVTHTGMGTDYLRRASVDGYLTLSPLPDDAAQRSQEGTLRRKKAFRNAGKVGKALMDIYASQRYRNWILSGPEWLFTWHCRTKDFLERRIVRKSDETVVG